MKNINLSDIFIPALDKEIYSMQELLFLEIKRDFITNIEYRLQLTYLKKLPEGGNLCFIKNKHLRPEFRMFFDKSDIVDYIIFVFKKDEINLKTDTVPLPETSNFLRRSKDEIKNNN